MSQLVPVDAERLSPTEEATANVVEADLQDVFERWEARGFPRQVTVPMMLLTAVDIAKRSGVTFESAVETLQLIWHGEPS